MSQYATIARTGPLQASCLRLVLALALGLGSVLPGPGRAAPAGDGRATVTLDGFATRGSREDGSSYWELRGERAVMTGVEAELEHVRLELFNGSKPDVVRMTSPRCSFNRATQTARSDAPLRVEGEAFQVEGVGYDILVPQQKLHVRRQAKLTIWYTPGATAEHLRLKLPTSGSAATTSAR